MKFKEGKRVQGSGFRVALCGLPCAMMCAVLPSCMTASGSGAQWSITAVGTDLDGLSIDGGGMKAEAVKQSASLKAVLTAVQKSWANYLIAAGLKYVAGKYYDQQGAVTSAETTVKLENLRNAKGKDEAAAALERLKVESAAAEAAAVVTPVG